MDGLRKTIHSALVPFHCKLTEASYFVKILRNLKVGNRVFIVMDAQVYKLNDSEALEVSERQNIWLEDILASTSHPKTVFVHTPLWLETPDETFPGEEHESIPKAQRKYLIDLFANHGVDSIFSGHVHFQNLNLEPHRGIKQHILTSINAQDEWFNEETGMTWGKSEPAYYRVHVVNGNISDIVTITKSANDPMLEELRSNSYKHQLKLDLYSLLTFVFLFLSF